jgi:hypothetical protein
VGYCPFVYRGLHCQHCRVTPAPGGDPRVAGHTFGWDLVGELVEIFDCVSYVGVKGDGTSVIEVFVPGLLPLF